MWASAYVWASARAWEKLAEAQTTLGLLQFNLLGVCYVQALEVSTPSCVFGLAAGCFMAMLVIHQILNAETGEVVDLGGLSSWVFALSLRGTNRKPQDNQRETTGKSSQLTFENDAKEG